MEKIKIFLSNRKNLQFLGGIVAGLVLGLVFILTFNPFNIKRIYQSPKAWIISQGLNSTLTRQQMLAKSGDFVKVATASTTIKAEVVKIGNDYLLSTGANGEVSANITKGVYKIGLTTIPGIDFTGVPEKLDLQGDYELKIGLVKGSGKIKTIDAVKTEASGSSKLTVKLFRSDGASLPWAGVTLKFTLLK